MHVTLYYDLLATGHRNVIEVRCQSTVLYSCLYSTQLERLIAALRAQRLCQQNSWTIIDILDGSQQLAYQFWEHI
jgi:hypothetical protein